MAATNDQIADLDTELDALSSPTTGDIYVVSKDYESDIVAASAVRRGLAGASWEIREPFANGAITSGGRVPNAITLNPAGDTLYVGSSDGIVVPIDLATGIAGAEIELDLISSVNALLFSPGGETLYAALNGGTVVPITTATGIPGTPITVGDAPQDLAITPNGTKLYVSNGNSGTVTPITTATATAGTPITVGTDAKALAMRPDGQTVYVANQFAGTVQKITVATNTAGAAVAVGTQPWGLQISPDGTSLYVANWGDDTIQAIDLATFTAGDPVTVGTGGQEPIGFALTADGSLLYVVLELGGLVPVPTATLVPEAQLTTIGSANTSNWLALSTDETKLYVANAVAPGIDYVLMRTITLDDVVGSLYNLATA